MPNTKQLTLNPIGTVKTETNSKTEPAQIIINKELTDALEGVTEFSHLYIIYWLHRTPNQQPKPLKVHPRGRKDTPLIGVFATRSPTRPNPIALTLVKLLKIEDNTLTVQGLDAIDGTPVLDIKPYDPWDTAKNPKTPEWWHKLESAKP